MTWQLMQIQNLIPTSLLLLEIEKIYFTSYLTLDIRSRA